MLGDEGGVVSPTSLPLDASKKLDPYWPPGGDPLTTAPEPGPEPAPAAAPPPGGEDAHGIDRDPADAPGPALPVDVLSIDDGEVPLTLVVTVTPLSSRSTDVEETGSGKAIRTSCEP
jgi:hypothetical protein